MNSRNDALTKNVFQESLFCLMVGAHARDILEMTYNKLSNIAGEDLLDEFGHAHCRTVSHCHKCDRPICIHGPFHTKICCKV